MERNIAKFFGQGMPTKLLIDLLGIKLIKNMSSSHQILFKRIQDNLSKVKQTYFENNSVKDATLNPTPCGKSEELDHYIERNLNFEFLYDSSSLLIIICKLKEKPKFIIKRRFINFNPNKFKNNAY